MVQTGSQLNELYVTGLATQPLIQRHDAQAHIFRTRATEALQDIGSGSTESDDDDTVFLAGN